MNFIISLELVINNYDDKNNVGYNSIFVLLSKYLKYYNII